MDLYILCGVICLRQWSSHWLCISDDCISEITYLIGFTWRLALVIVGSFSLCTAYIKSPSLDTYGAAELQMALCCLTGI